METEELATFEAYVRTGGPSCVTQKEVLQVVLELRAARARIAYLEARYGAPPCVSTLEKAG